MNEKRSVSVVICTYNRHDELKKTLDGVFAQDYPRDKYEVIVVDDGSTDGTPRLCEKYPLKYIRHTENAGIPVVRNKGLFAAKNEIVAYLDDDCIAAPNWLSEFVKVYDDPDVMAAGGLIVARDEKSVTSRYMAQMGYGNPHFFSVNKSMSIFDLLLYVIKIRLFPIFEMKGNVFPIKELCGANCSFRRDKALAVGGYDETLMTSEDTKIAKDMLEQFPQGKIVYTKSAVVAHKHHTSFFKYMKNEFVRAKNTFKVFQQEVKYPPISPFSLMVLFMLIVLLFVKPDLVLPAVFILPQLAYFWWPMKLFMRGKLSFLLFPYMQFFLELSRTVGIIYGFVRK